MLTANSGEAAMNSNFPSGWIFCYYKSFFLQYIPEKLYMHLREYTISSFSRLVLKNIPFYSKKLILVTSYQKFLALHRAKFQIW